MDAGEDFVGRRVERLAAVEHLRSERAVKLCYPLASDNRQRAAARVSGCFAGQPLVAVGDLRRHIGNVEARYMAGAVKKRRCRFRLICMDVNPQRYLIANNEDRIAKLLKQGDVLLRRAKPLSTARADRKVGAETKG